ncbi:MAG TPA: immune inhibitor A domain-containing protein [Lentibacillus sp.]|uniref:immune inhibitor A domain-containing protein n=1 Tax=Lentibacillus sp. TaxID=1925746 RepID=UPI002B4AFC1D|nr:immune inhibitor A domain-containing protein [Lentibacillus sp.]HLR63477.1 immune inhibitor A domain-containing protein [Lentibacillus sp.]
MKKGFILSAAAALTLSLGLPVSAEQGSSTNTELKSQVSSTLGSPIDMGVANDEKLIEMLKEKGTIAKDASASEANEALKKYLQSKSEGSKKMEVNQTGTDDAKMKNKEKKNNNPLTNGKGNKLGHAKKNHVDPVEKENYNGEVREDKVLVLAIDFPDYSRNSIQPGETDMYYDDYTDEHFQNMIFGENGYEGPNGENLVSMKQYYEAQSGGSYTVDGQIAGWYTTENPAAYYGGNYPAPDGSDARPRELVYEALVQASEDPSIDLSEYDAWDRNDYDGDGVYDEPDGLIDHLMVIHAGVGEEAGGGALGGDAIWSHRWNLGNQPVAVPGAESDSDRFGGALGAWDYTIEPEDGAAGVFAHEYGHDLGLPDEYDTQYTGEGEAVAYWSLMASGSWAGDVPGTEPPGMSPFAKEMLQTNHGGNWLSGTTIDSSDVTENGTSVLLDEGVTKGTNNDAVRVNLPQKENVLTTPASGENAYYGGKGNEVDNKMAATVDLTGVSNATLDFDTWYNIESNWDFAMAQVSTDGGETWESLSSERTTDVIDPNGYPAIKENLPGYTGSSDGWVHESIDISEYAGQEIQIQFRSMTDWATNLDGIFFDNVNVTADGEEVFQDGAEGDTQFDLNGFEKHDGTYYTDHYYLLEWRSHNGVDEGLANIRRGDSLMSYGEGLVVWYVDESYDNNWTGQHPGEGFLGVVDADQRAVKWSDHSAGATRYQLHDAAFTFEKTDKMFLDYLDLQNVTMKDNYTKRTPLFDDSADWSNPGLVDAGRNVPEYGLNFRVIGKSDDNTVGDVLLFK